MEQLKFAGSTVGEPWWITGLVATAALSHHGYDVSVTDESFSDRNTLSLHPAVERLYRSLGYPVETLAVSA